MAPRAFWIACTLMGIATLFVTLAIFPLFPSDAAADVSGYGGPIYAFEFARTLQHLRDVFGFVDDPARARRIAMMDAGNHWDFLFMTIYSLFGVCFGVAAASRGSKVWICIAIISVVSLVADVLETRILLTVTDVLKVEETEFPSLAYLWIPVTVKFSALGATVMGAGLYVATRRGVVWALLGGLAMLASLLVIPGLIAPSAYGGLLGMAIGVGWIVMLAYAMIRAIRGPVPPLAR